MNDAPKAVTALEYTWARAVLGTIFPACPEAGVTRGIVDLDLATFIDELEDSVPWLTFFGIRLFIILIALSPLLVLGKLKTMAGLERRDREAVVFKIGKSNVYLVRQMVLALKAMFALCFGGGDELQAICRSEAPKRDALVGLGRKTAA